MQERVQSGDLAPSVAAEIGKLDDPADQAEVAAAIVAGGLSRAEAVEVVRRKAPPAKGRGGSKGRKATVRTYRAAGLKVTVEGRRGLDDAAVAAALREVLAHLDGPGAEAA